MKATIWTQKGCWRCDAEKKRLGEKGYELDEHDAEEIESGLDVDIRAAFAMQNDELPLVRIGGEFRGFQGD